MARPPLKQMRPALRAFLVVGAVTAGGLHAGSWLARSALAQGADPYLPLDTLAQALHHIESQYLEVRPTKELVEGAIEGMTDKLDPHSRFLDAKELEAAQVRTEGIYSGLGVELRDVGDLTIVSRVIPGSPADGSVLRGDHLVEIDDTAVESLAAAATLLRGEVGTKVKLMLLRESAPLTLTLTRSRIRDRSVRVDDLGSGWSYAEITRFQRNTADDLRRGLEQAQPSAGVVLDLRGNGGGLLEEAVDTVDLFATSGLIVKTIGRNGEEIEQHYATPSAPFASLKVMVMIDGESASASEIVAGALRTLSGATLVGSPSFGKWSVQRMYVFEDKSALKLTIARYELAEHPNPEAMYGLQPDHLVRRPGATEQAADVLARMVSGDVEATAHLDTLVSSIEHQPAPRLMAPLAERLTKDPQMKAAWTLARENR